jgi:hypothetical protein
MGRKSRFWESICWQQWRRVVVGWEAVRGTCLRNGRRFGDERTWAMVFDERSGNMILVGVVEVPGVDGSDDDDEDGADEDSEDDDDDDEDVPCISLFE